MAIRRAEAAGAPVYLGGPAGAPGGKGDTGLAGPANALAIGVVTTAAAGAAAAATVTGAAPNQTLNLTIPQGNVGASGPANALAIGTVTTGAAGSSAAATVTGAAPSQTLNLTIPKGDAGAAGPANTLAIGTVSTGAAGSSAAASIAGAAPSQTLSLTIPKGDTGASGPANTLAIGAVTTGAAGSAAAASVTGSAPNQTLNLTIPQGNAGGAGPAGPQPWQTPPVAWAASTAYTATAPASCVIYGGSCYVCSTAHTSTASFDASKWTQIAASGLSGGALLAANNLSDLGSAQAAKANLGDLPEPQGRLTLTSGVSVTTVGVSAAGTVYYTPEGRLTLVGTGLATPPVPVFFVEVFQALSDATKSPSAAAAGTVYDKFSWLDGSTHRVTRGPAWSAGTGGSNMVRGTGAGSTELIRVGGVMVNRYAITNGPAAGMGVYVGTIMTDASGATVSHSFGGAAAGGTPAVLGVWNAFNRRPVSAEVNDTTASWTYASSTPRPADTSTAMRVTFVTGLAEDPIEATYGSYGTGGSNEAHVLLGIDSTSAQSTGQIGTIPAGTSGVVTAAQRQRLLGAHYVQALERSLGGTATYYGGTGLSRLAAALRM